MTRDTGYVENEKTRRRFRIFALFLMTALWIILVINLGLNIWNIAAKFTQWGMTMVTILFVFGLKMQSPASRFYDFQSRQDIFVAWKIYNIICELAIPMEGLVTVYFWTSLFNPNGKEWLEFTILQKIGNCSNHSVPLTLLIIEFVFFSSVQTMPRHIFSVLTMTVVYLSVNCIWCFAYKPVYPAMTWRGASGLIIPFILVGFACIIYLLMIFLSRKRNGWIGKTLMSDKIANRI
jgi:hypothetical protein